MLADIKKFQAKIKLEDSLVEETIRESTRSYVEARLEKATQCLKQRGRVRDYSELVKVKPSPPSTNVSTFCYFFWLKVFRAISQQH